MRGRSRAIPESRVYLFLHGWITERSPPSLNSTAFSLTRTDLTMQILFLLLVSLLLACILKFIHSVMWVPWRIQVHFRRQGINGPSYRLLLGNAPEFGRLFSEARSKPMPFNHDVVPRVAPFYHEWSRKYGKTFLYWFGTKPTLAISDPDMIKEVLMNTGDGSFEKARNNPLAKLLFGQGLIGLNGDEWAHHRRIANQAFMIERVKVKSNAQTNQAFKMEFFL